MRIRIIRLPPTAELQRLEVNASGLLVGGVYDLSMNAASYLLLMGFAEPDQSSDQPAKSGVDR